MKVCIDPGHGGRDPGATNQDLYEKDIVLDVGKKLRNILRYWEYGTVITRQGDRFVSLNTRMQFAVDNECDAFISIHCNAVGDPNVSGTETFHYPNSKLGIPLARCVQSELVRITRRNDRGIKPGNFRVLHVRGIPAILVELGFLSNAEKYKLFQEDYFNFMKAMAVAEGLEKYREGVL